MKRPLLIGLLVEGVLLTQLRVGTAEACSPHQPPPGYGAFVRGAPADGATGVPTNAAVVLDLELHGQPRDVAARVTEADTGAVVAGTQAVYHWDPPFLAWRPAAPLRSQTRYRVDATVVSDVVRPAAATGVEQLSFTFTTGVDPLPAIALQGGMQVTLETEQREDLSRCTSTPVCGDSCGTRACACTSTLAREQHTIARVRLPAFSGGLQAPGYTAVVRVTADTPYRFPPGDENLLTGVRATGSMFDMAPGGSQEVVVYGLDQLAPYRPCFALRAEDVAGNVRDAEPVCLSEVVQPSRKLPLPPGTRVTSIGHGGCSVGGTTDRGALALALALLAAGLYFSRARAAARRRSSSGETSSLCVATYQTWPKGSVTPPERSP